MSVPEAMGLLVLIAFTNIAICVRKNGILYIITVYAAKAMVV